MAVWTSVQNGNIAQINLLLYCKKLCLTTIILTVEFGADGDAYSMKWY